jgi:hypothetical protein
MYKPAAATAAGNLTPTAPHSLLKPGRWRAHAGNQFESLSGPFLRLDCPRMKPKLAGFYRLFDTDAFCDPRTLA